MKIAREQLPKEVDLPSIECRQLRGRAQLRELVPQMERNLSSVKGCLRGASMWITPSRVWAKSQDKHEP